MGRCRDVLQECIRLDPGKVEPRILLGEAYSRSKAYDKALAEYEVMAKLDANNPQSYISLGRTYYYLERYPDSLAALTKARKLDPANAQAAYYLGLIAEKNDDEKTASMRFQEALKTDPKHLGTLYEYGVLLSRLNSFAEARTYLERAAQVSPAFSQTYYRLTLVYKRLNEMELSTKAFERFQQCKRDEERANYRPYGVLAFVKETQDLPDTERLRRYRGELARAEQSRPNDVNVMFMLAQIDLRLGDTAQSLRPLRSWCRGPRRRPGAAAGCIAADRVPLVSNGAAAASRVPRGASRGSRSAGSRSPRCAPVCSAPPKRFRCCKLPAHQTPFPLRTAICWVVC